MQGNALDRELYLYDIVSAYPSEMVDLPSMRDGTWTMHGIVVDTLFINGPWQGPQTFDPQTYAPFDDGDSEAIMSGLGGTWDEGEWDPDSLPEWTVTQYVKKEAIQQANMISMFRLRWSFPIVSPWGRSNGPIPFYPFPYREKTKTIIFPSAGRSWIMQAEAAAALDWIETFGLDTSMLEIEERNEFVPGNDERPYSFVAELFEMRRQAKSKKEYDIAEMAIKLCLNSLYGKTVQSVGGTELMPRIVLVRTTARR